MFEEETFRLLSTLARKKETSVGALVRRAVRKIYIHSDKAVLARRKEAYQRLLSWQKRVGSLKDIDYRALIEDGRIR